MKKWVALLSLLYISFAVLGQQNYFVYIQTDNKQPFYVKVNEKILSSSATGYLVIPKLTTGNYAITVGFPKDQWTQQKFNLAIDNIDVGFLLKNFEDKGWGLYNILTMEIVMNGSNAPIKKKNADDEVFANTISGATNTKISTPIAKATVAKIIKISSKNKADGRLIVYTIQQNNVTDTIDVLIPTEKVFAKKIENEKAEIINTVKVPDAEIIEETKPNIVTISTPKKDIKFLDIDMEKPATKEIVIEKKVEPMVTPAKQIDKPTVPFNSDCKSIAVEDDFFKLRKKMAADDSDDAMVETARKIFKVKCFSVEQIKNLSLLFLNDAGKYKFYDAAYPYSSDTQNFIYLQSQIKEEYYINRFKAMLRN